MGVALDEVTDLRDPRLYDYRDLRDQDLRRAERFIVESEVVLRVLVERGRHPIRSVLLAEQKAAKLGPLLAAVEAPVYVAPQAVMDGVIGFHIHRGVLAACDRVAVPRAREWLAAHDWQAAGATHTLVVLEALANHDNVGGVFRSAAAFGADGVIHDRVTCDPLYRKAIRVSVGGSLIVPYAECDAITEVMPALHAAGFETWALTPDHGAVDIRTIERPRRVALFLGTEGVGLSSEVLEAATRRVRVDIEPGFDSLNVATTAGIALHALRPPPARA